MKKEMKWGLATLILLLGIAAVFLFIDKDTDTEPEMTLGQQTKDLLNKPRPQPQKDASSAASKQMPGETETGHVHEDGTVHQGTHASMQQTQPANTVSEEVIYPHHELLQTHPVAALRAQARDSGHWSARYIPPFPPDDVEANELARNYYIDNYYKSRNDFYNPVASKARKVISKWHNDNGSYTTVDRSSRPRYCDLFRLDLTNLDDPGSGEFAWTKLAWEMESNFTREDYVNANIQ